MIESAILIGLASWRLASMLVGEDGPALIFQKIRVRVGAEKEGRIEGFLPTLFSCIYCMSVWTTLSVYLLWKLIPIAVMIIAAMAIALIVNRFAKPEGD